MLTASASSLSSEQLSEYASSGFLILRDVFTHAEIAAAEAESNLLWWGQQDLIDSNNLRCRWQNHVETGECLFECFDPVIDIGPVCRQLAHDRRVLDPLAALYGDEPCLFKDKLIFKPPGAKGYGLHQDYIAWKGFPRSFVTVLIAIDRAEDINGATEVFPGYHHNGCLTPEDGMYHELPLATIDEATGVRLDLCPGDIAIFGAFTPHRSAPNRSNRWRRQLYLSYNAHNDGGSRREAHYREFHAWLKERYAEYGKHNVYFK